MQDTLLSNVIRTTSRHIEKLSSLGLRTVKDILLYFPRTHSDSRSYTKIQDIETGKVLNIKGQITRLFSMKTKYGKTIIRGNFEDETGKIEVVWFNQPYVMRALPRNKDVILTGKVKFAFGKSSMQSPTFELAGSQKQQIHTGLIAPVYPESDMITTKWIREKIKPNINKWVKMFKEHLPDHILEKHELISFQEAVKNIHFPENMKMLEKAQKRLAFDELFLLQLRVLNKKWHWQNIEEKYRKSIKKHHEVLEEAKKSLPFTLTNAQIRVLDEILTDLEQGLPMKRLVQGDVGSGKTIVAALAALNVVKNGYQVAIMAPTEILAKQHYKSMSKVLKPYSLNIQFVAGSTPQKTKDDIIMQMKTGTVDIVIGTHALIQKDIGFSKLGLAIIDEQHRFGVKQRDTLRGFGVPHMLNMTATPIPRTLAITVYGDQDISIIDEMPEGRQEIITRLVPEKKRLQAYRWIEDQVAKGRQAFVVCPLIDESETIDVRSVLQEYAYLSEHIFPDLNVGLLHGKLKQDEKDNIMQDFKNNKINILVSTSVIEVGIDVPNATIIMIEGAQRFGLAQLHQFRGRVGRGKHKSYCLLFTGNLSETGRTRMKAMEEYTSGFKLAEIDLELRGPGEVYGVKQSGIPDLKVASISDTKTIEKARNCAKKIIDESPNLEKYPLLLEKIIENQNRGV